MENKETVFNTEIDKLIDSMDLTKEPPIKEPERQYWFMKKARQLVQEKEKELGRPLTACTVTFGCQMNSRDSEKLAGVLERIGYVETEDENADFVIYNTCTVRENANQRVYGRLGYLHSLKKKNPHMMIALCGCMMQEPQVVEKIRTSYPFVDLIFGTHNIFVLAELVSQCLIRQNVKKHRTVIDVWDGTDQIVEDLPADRKYPFKSGVNIMFGCNNFCSYCIVPYVRGRERSRKPEDILNEVRELVAEGYKDITLLGQNVNSYGKDLEEPMDFADLLEQVNAVPGDFLIRFMTSHPKDATQKLFETMARCEKVAPVLHLPFQAGNDRVLKVMNRKHTIEQYLDKIRALRALIPDIVLTSDVIVGFPGETTPEFEDTLKVLEEVRFDALFTFIYSPRVGTPAAKMDDPMSREEKLQNFNRLVALQDSISEEKHAAYIGKTMRCLVDGESGDSRYPLSARTPGNRLVRLTGNPDVIGQFVQVKITDANKWSLFGEMA